MDDEKREVLRADSSKQETRAFYNDLSRFYDTLAERSEAPAQRAGLARLAARPGERLLEVGSGTGHCLAELARAVGPGGRAFGVDLSEGMLLQSRRQLDGEGLSERVELARGDAEHLPFATGSMDGIFMSFTLELFDTPAIPRVLAECRRVLRSGGRLVVVGMTKAGEGQLAVKVFEWAHRHFPRMVDCRPIFVRHSLESAGFRIEAAEIDRIWIPVEIVRGTIP